MIVVDVLLGLNLVALGACALRGQTNKRVRLVPVKVENNAPAAKSRGQSGPGDAVIIPFPVRRPANAIARAMALHPSADNGAPSHH